MSTKFVLQGKIVYVAARQQRLNTGVVSSHTYNNTQISLKLVSNLTIENNRVFGRTSNDQ